MSLKVFVRQPFTQSSEGDQTTLQGSMDVLKELKERHKLNFLTSLEAQSADSFKSSFQKYQGQKFTPQNFRRYRLGLIDKSDAFVVLRTGLSESGSFEMAYNIFSGRCSPVFFAIWRKVPIKTTLLRDLQDLVDVTYFEFNSPRELREPLEEFFSKLTQQRLAL